jgi:hypothetical protein
LGVLEIRSKSRESAISKPESISSLTDAADGIPTMLKSLKEILTKQAPDLLARTELPRKDPRYLTQRQAFDIYRKRRRDDLAKQDPD